MAHQSQEKFSLVRSILKTFGLPQEAVEDIIDRINDFLSDKDGKESIKAEFPYFVRDDFLSPAEHSFYLVLKAAISGSAIICPKVSLGDLFYAKSNDASKYRTYTNKIDRKHVDFLICNLNTLRPLAGIELDDKSHQRIDRQVRDEFVKNVFQAAKLPLVRIPVKNAYSVVEIRNLLEHYIALGKPSDAMPTVSEPEKINKPPRCPKCGGEMALRTAKSGVNQGGQFWGCVNFPQCRGILKYEA